MDDKKKNEWKEFWFNLTLLGLFFASIPWIFVVIIKYVSVVWKIGERWVNGH